MKSDGIDPISEGRGTKTENRTANQNVDCIRRPKRVAKVMAEDKVGSPRKLNFTRGKVVDVHAKNTSPGKLKFKQGRVLGENQKRKDDTNRRSLKEVAVFGVSNGSEVKHSNIVLRHQVAEGKKGGQSLFNNVIEETASKLVQTRKSKVKALVGAFETVISLQDCKSLAKASSAY